MWNLTGQSIGMVKLILENTYLQALTFIKLKLEIIQILERW